MKQLMKWVLVFGIFLLCTSLVDSTPVGIASRDRKRLGAEEKRSVGKFTFKGGERACIIVEGDHRPVVDLFVEVFDEQGNLVAQDRHGGDLCAVIWYPPEDGEYDVHVHNTGKDWNELTLVFK